MEKDLYLGVDLGGTKIMTALAQGDGDLLAQTRVPTGAQHGQGHVLDQINGSVATVLAQAGVGKKRIHSLGVGAPSPLLPQEGILYNASNLGWQNVPLQKILEKEWGFPVHLENDANAAAWGEKWFGAGQGYSHLIYITVSTGIGGGIILEDRIYRGSTGSAGEFGHIPVVFGGSLCGCGKRGCLETVASGPALIKKAQLLALQEKTRIGELAGEVEKIDGEILMKAAQEGDSQAIQLYWQLAQDLGQALAGVATIFNPQCLIIGGGVAGAGDLLFEPLQEAMARETFAPAWKGLDILPAHLGGRSGLYGALSLVLYPPG